MLIGYARVSTLDQNLDRQIDGLIDYGISKRNIYKEKITGTTKDRPQLIKMIEELEKDDIVIVFELSRLSRSTKDLFTLIDLIEKKGAQFKSLKESWLDTTTATGKLIFTFMAGITQFERDLLSEKTKEGLNAARARGRHGGRPKTYNKLKIKLAIEMYLGKKYTIAEITDATGLSKTSLYRFIKAEKIELLPYK